MSRGKARIARPPPRWFATPPKVINNVRLTERIETTAWFHPSPAFVTSARDPVRGHMNQTVNCPVCETVGCTMLPKDGSFPGSSYNCDRCGKFTFWGSEFPDGYLTPRRRAILSHRMRRRQPLNGNPFVIVQDDLPALKLDEPLPNPAEQADYLILWIG
jgi:hypothetical protein